MSVTARGMSVQEAYREYRAGNFRINRRYQRKLVWTIEEKQALVDSILQGYPIPLILLAFSVDDAGLKSYEVLDGMQRLNAVFTFLENMFSVNGRFFDVRELSRAKQLADDGEFEAVSDPQQLISTEQCADILDYNFAVSEFPGANQGAVREVFSRINSYGKQLSQQEKRQAGVVSSFSDLVRELGAELRGDVSKTTLDLSEMPAISVDLGVGDNEYGVKADSTFWCHQGILRRSQLRDSDDEQLLADISISILEGKPFGFSGKALDQYYSDGTVEARSIAAQLATYGADNLKTQIVGTISVMREVIESQDDQPNALRRVVFPSSANPIKTAFYAVFNAFFRLCVNDQKRPADSAKIVKALTGIQDKLNVAAGQIRSDPRQENIAIVKALIEPYFEDSEPPAILHGAGACVRLENALRRSRIETAAYECKQGLLRLDAERALDGGMINKIVETVCGIANVGPDSEGAIFVGVADSESDKNRVEELDSVVSAHIGNRFVVGVDRESERLSEDIESYVERISNGIKDSGLSSGLKADVLAKLDCVTYRGFSVICVWVPAQQSYSSISDKIFIRENSSTKEASGAAAMSTVIKRFQ